ncbi:MAG: hypothetical protein AMJ90_04845 [candidate division Zixibacteria bacterium SM23_73_2]|nr:MAG: hypothetical protein AMJ90_04845 [candidate division Zixibacteria bacterium SM23_73_2]
MKRIILISAILLLFGVPLLAQPVDTAWIRTYNGPGNGDDIAYDLAIDDSGYIYVTGGSWEGAVNTHDYATIKYNQAGNQIWVKSYDGPGNYEDNAKAIAVDDSGNVFVTGISYGSGTNYDYATIKYYPDGDTAWVRRYDGPGNDYDYAFDAAVDDSGNIYVTGVSVGSGSSADYATIKYNPDGDTVWVRRYNGSGNSSDWAHGICVDGSGNVYVTGESYESSLDYTTIKYNPDGDTVWVRGYGSASYADRAYAIAVDLSGNVYVTGTSTGFYEDIVTIRYYPGGDTAWVRRYNGEGNNADEGYAITVDSCGNVYVTGRSYGSGSFFDYITVKYDSTGIKLWDASYNGTGNSVDEAQDIAVDDSLHVYVTGKSYGTDYDYATVKYDPDGNQRWVERYNSGHEPGDEAYGIAVDSYGNVFVSGGGYDYATIKYIQVGGEKTIILKDGSASQDPIGDKTFSVSKVTNNPPVMSETYLGDLTTNGDGRITIPEGWFDPGDWVKVERLVHTEPAAKHISLLPNMYYIKINNASFDTTTGAISYYSFTSDSLQEIIVDHATVMFDLLVSVEWDADQQYLENLRDGFKFISNYLYDVTDGQLYVDSVKIYDAKVNWGAADVRIYASNMEWPHATIYFKNDGTPLRLGGGIFGSGDQRLFFPRIFYYNSHDGNRNLTYDLYPYDWTIAQTSYDHDNSGTLEYPDEYKAYPPSRTLAHEFGHYGIGFRDEYIDENGNRVLDDFDFGMMDDQLGVDVEQNSEMSSLLQYDDDAHKVTAQWVTRGDRSCWDYFEWNYQDTYDGIYVPIKKPSTQMFGGPNDDLLALNYDVSSYLASAIIDSNRSAYELIVISTDELGSPVGNSNVLIYKDNHTWFIDQGNTADSGGIRCLGVNDEDIIRIYRDTLYLELEVSVLYPSRFGDRFRTSADGDTIEAVLRTVKGHYLMLNRGWFDDENSFGYDLRTNVSFSQDPDLEFYTPYGQMFEYEFSPVSNGYQVTVTDSLSSNGIFSVIAVDDSGYVFFVNNGYTVTRFSDSLFIPDIYAHQGALNLHLDELNTSFQKIAILSSDFPPLLNGLDSLAEQGGGVHSISAYPDISSLSGEDNYAVIRYADTDLKNNPEASLKIFKWSQSSSRWECIGGAVDTIRNEIVVSVQSLGTYAAFTTSVMCGDVNGDGSINLSDPICLANYYFGKPCDINPFASDVNCDTMANLGDALIIANVYFGKPGFELNCCP